LDSEPGQSLEPWSGASKIASPETQEAEDALIQQLLTHRTLLVRVGSDMMDKFVEDEFDLIGFADAFKAFDAECQSIRSPMRHRPSIIRLGIAFLIRFRIMALSAPCRRATSGLSCRSASLLIR
jgi:hypothetical protein